MKRMSICFRGERALFRNLAVPGSDVADHDMSHRTRAVQGLIGNLLGLWRDFDDPTHLDLAPSLQNWWREHKVEIDEIDYHAPETRVIGQHRYKTTNEYTTDKKSGPKNLTYHWNARITVHMTLDAAGADALGRAIRQPVGTPYLGQSNCLAQVHLLQNS